MWRTESGIARRRIGMSIAVAEAVAACAFGRGAHAEPTPQDIATAKANLAEGRSLRKSGDTSGARRRFLAAWALVPTPITGIEAARAEAEAGHWIEARDICLSIGRIPVASSEKAEHATARSDADALAESLRAKIPSIVLSWANPSAPVPEDLAVYIDGKPIKSALIGVTLVVNPGSHRVMVTRGTETKSVDLEAVEGEHGKPVTIPALIVVTAPAPVPTVPAVIAAVPPPDPGAVRPSRPRSQWATVGPWVLGGIGVAALGASAGFAAASKGRWNSSNQDDHCYGDDCDAVGLSIRQDARTLGDVATILVVAGGVTTAGALVWFIARPSSMTPGEPSPSERRSWRPTVGIGPASVVVSGFF